MTEKKIRRSPEELAAHHKALAHKHEMRARYAQDSTLKAIGDMSSELEKLAENDHRFQNEQELNEQFGNAMRALGFIHNELAK